MAEYIDREAFKKEYLCCGYLPEMSETEFDTFPSADVAPVRHGRWIKRKTWNFHVCSECSFETRPYMSCMNYCPNCGAKMDLEHAQKGGDKG